MVKAIERLAKVCNVYCMNWNTVTDDQLSLCVKLAQSVACDNRLRTAVLCVVDSIDNRGVVRFGMFR
jgi:hypothetical protein